MQKPSQWSWDVLLKWSVVVEHSYDAASGMFNKKRRWRKVGEDEGSPVLYGRERWEVANDMRAFHPTLLTPFHILPIRIGKRALSTFYTKSIAHHYVDGLTRFSLGPPPQVFNLLTQTECLLWVDWLTLLLYESLPPLPTRSEHI